MHLYINLYRVGKMTIQIEICRLVNFFGFSFRFSFFWFFGNFAIKLIKMVRNLWFSLVFRFDCSFFSFARMQALYSFI